VARNNFTRSRSFLTDQICHLPLRTGSLTSQSEAAGVSIFSGCLPADGLGSIAFGVSHRAFNSGLSATVLRLWFRTEHAGVAYSHLSVMREPPLGSDRQPAARRPYLRKGMTGARCDDLIAQNLGPGKVLWARRTGPFSASTLSRQLPPGEVLCFRRPLRRPFRAPLKKRLMSLPAEGCWAKSRLPTSLSGQERNRFFYFANAVQQAKVVGRTPSKP